MCGLVALLITLSACTPAATPSPQPTSEPPLASPQPTTPTGSPTVGAADGLVYAYLPAQGALAVRALGEAAQVTWEGQPIEVTLVGLAEPPETTPQPLTKELVTVWEIANKGQRDLEMNPASLFAGMNSLDRSLELAAADPLSVPAGESALLELQWATARSDERLRLWITFNMPILAGGYVGLREDAAVFSYYLDEFEYPQGTPTPCLMAVRFVREAPEDGIAVAPGARLEKTWVIANAGTCRWPEGSLWAHYAGESLGASAPVLLPSLPRAGGLLTVTLPMTAPLAAGTHVGEWALQSPSGEFYGRTFQARITVIGPGS